MPLRCTRRLDAGQNRVHVLGRSGPGQGHSGFVDAPPEHQVAGGLGQAQQRRDEEYRRKCREPEHHAPTEGLGDSAQRECGEIPKDDADHCGYLVGDEGRTPDARGH